MHRKEEGQPVFEDEKIFIEHGPELRIDNWSINSDEDGQLLIYGGRHMGKGVNASSTDFSGG